MMLMLICGVDFVSINKDFQKFVAMVCETVSANNDESHTVKIPSLLQMQPVVPGQGGKTYSTVEQALGDLVASIR